jgi:hypothetical protein
VTIDLRRFNQEMSQAGIVVFCGTTLRTRSTAAANVDCGVRNFIDPPPVGVAFVP